MTKEPIREELIQRVLDINDSHYRLFSSPQECLRRRAHRAKHPTEFMAGKCMDGRLNLAVITQTPMGIIQPCRNMGGVFDLGWMAFQLMITQWVDYSMGRGRKCIFFATYHYSKGDRHRGCAGHGYDTDKAIGAAQSLKDQFDRVFGRSVISAIMCGVETDSEALIFHGDGGEVWDLSTSVGWGQEELLNKLGDIYPSLDRQIIQDLLPMVEGNIRHIKCVAESQRPVVTLQHQEWILGLGRGFDWLHTINQALIIGPFDLKVAQAVETAGNILLDNIVTGRNSYGGAVLVSAAPYRDGVGPEPFLAMEKARVLEKFALEIFQAKVPDLLPHLATISGTVNMTTRKLTLLN
jgi:hypothetical protein